MVTQPCISVIIPTCGRPVALERAIRSVLRQTWTQLEVIVVIDASDPATDALLDGLTDSRVTSIRTSGKVGPGTARNMGCAAAQGEWIAFLDDDDLWLPDKLTMQMAEADRRGGEMPCIIACLSEVRRPGGSDVQPAAPFGGDLPIDEWLFDRPSWLGRGAGFIQTSSLLCPRALMLQNPFPARRSHEDWEMVIRAVKQHQARLVFVPLALVVHFQGVETQQNGPSLSATNVWRQSLAWVEETGGLLSPRAISGFCLVHVARSAAVQDGWRAAPDLLRAGYANGAPTLRQVFAFAAIFAVPAWLKSLWRRSGSIKGG